MGSTTVERTRYRVVPAVDKAARLLLELDAVHPRGISDLARGIDASKGTVRDILLTLASHGLITREDDGRFRAGWPPIRPEVVQRHLDELMREAGHTAILGVLRGSRVEIVARAEPSSDLHMSAPIGRRIPVRVGAHRKVLLDGEQIGYDDEEYLQGVRAAAAPLVDATGRRVGAVIVVGFKEQIDARSLRRIGRLCARTAEALTEAIGLRSLGS